MTKWAMALFAWVTAISFVPSSNAADTPSNRRTVFKQLLRIYGCAHVVYRVAIASQTSSHGGLIFERKIDRIRNGDREFDFVSAEKLRCGRVIWGEELSASAQRVWEDIERDADRIADAMVNQYFAVGQLKTDIAAALRRFGGEPLPRIEDIAQPRDLDLAIDPLAGGLLRTYYDRIELLMPAR